MIVLVPPPPHSNRPILIFHDQTSRSPRNTIFHCFLFSELVVVVRLPFFGVYVLFFFYPPLFILGMFFFSFNESWNASAGEYMTMTSLTSHGCWFTMTIAAS